MTLDKYRVDETDLDDERLAEYHPEDSVIKKSRRRLREAYERHRQALVIGNLEREQPFSWQYCLLSFLAYILMLSDVFRTGLAIHHLPYRTLEPDSYVYFGPLNYVTHHLTTQNATDTATTKFWAYKYDTTSQTMRTFAEYFQLDAWPPCVLYKESCDETQGIPLSSVFAMVDSLVDSVATHKGAHHDSLTRGLGVVTLRSHNVYKDRVYHYALPWFFNLIKKRTSQAIHHTHLHWHRFASVCAEKSEARRPYSCAQGWTNGRRLNCDGSVTDAACQTDTPRIWDHMPVRQAELARAYPNHTIDFVILDGMEDYPRGSLTFQGRKDVDVVVFSRIQKCDLNGSCKTIAVDDYRYEAAVFVMNALDWYTFVGILRAVGQTYAWVRLIALVIGCCVARMREPRFQGATLVARIVVTTRTVFLIPSQVVVYGSTFPISCYLLAHLIDSPAAYAMVQAYFTSLLGQMHWSMGDFFQHCAVSMRTVWVVGFICHRIVYITTASNWSPIHGVPGMAEFAITFIAALTIFAQFRSLSFRNTKVLEIYEVVPSGRRHNVLSESLDTTHGAINNLLTGSPIDMQCLLCGFLGLSGITLFVWLIRHAYPKLMPMRLTLTSSTIAPYSAGMLWPRSRLVVSWYGTVLTFDGETNKSKRSVKPEANTASERHRSAMDSMRRARELYRQLMDMPDKAMVMRETTISKLLQRDMHSVDRRTREIESTVYLVNLAVMTDPFTFLDLRVFDGRLVGLYEVKSSKRCFLLPFGLMTCEADIPIVWDDLELVAVVNTKDLEWPDLLRCG